MEENLSGQGSPLVKAAANQGIPIKVARTWRGPDADRLKESQLKHHKNSPRLCPDCNPDNWDHHGW